MIKIIKKGTIQERKCEKCGCFFSFEEEDITAQPRVNSFDDIPTSFVLCPQCGIKVFLKQVRGKC